MKLLDDPEALACALLLASPEYCEQVKKEYDFSKNVQAPKFRWNVTANAIKKLTGAEVDPCDQRLRAVRIAVAKLVKP